MRLDRRTVHPAWSLRFGAIECNIVDADMPMSPSYASPAIRDAFLRALDVDDRALSTRLARDLTECTNPLPGMTCSQLDLPIGSTYGCAARRVLLWHSEGQ